MKDTIYREDAIEAVNKEIYHSQTDRKTVVAVLSSLPSAETHEIRTETHGVCLISKDDAMGAVQDHFNANGFKGYDDGQKMMDRIKALPSADNSNAKTQNSNQETQNSNGDLIYRAEDRPTVIRSRTLMPTKDFMEWARRIRETNPNAVVIPCDAEVVSAEAVQGAWIEKGGELVCSVCGNSVSFSRTPKGWVLGRFCQTFGAKMKGGDSE